MFSALRLGSLVYILNKLNSPTLKVGIVQSVTSPFNSYGATSVDINVKVDNEVMDFKHLPAALNIANDNNSNVVISESKEAIILEIEGMISNSLDVINKIDYYKDVIVLGELMLRNLNPLYANQKEQEDKINNLESKVGGIENKLDSISEMLSKVLKV